MAGRGLYYPKTPLIDRGKRSVYYTAMRSDAGGQKARAPGRKDHMGEASGGSTQTNDFDEWIGAGDRLSNLTVSSAGATRQRAMDVLDGLAGKELVNAETGIKARINKKQRDKIISNTAVEKSENNGFDKAQHFAVAAVIDSAWKHATLLETAVDREGDTNIASMKRFAAPMLLDREAAMAYITAKESIQHGHRVYSLELREVKKMPAGRQQTN